MTSRPALTTDELAALPASVDLDTANRALNLGRSTGYRLARSGAYPVTVHRFGNAYRVAAAELRRLLQVSEAAEASAPDVRITA